MSCIVALAFHQGSETISFAYWINHISASGHHMGCLSSSKECFIVDVDTANHCNSLYMSSISALLLNAKRTYHHQFAFCNSDLAPKL